MPRSTRTRSPRALPLALVLAFAAALAACARPADPAAGILTSAAAQRPTRVVVRSSGGIANMEYVRIVDLGGPQGPYFFTTTRRRCAALGEGPADCGPALDSASAPLGRSAAAAVMDTVLAARFDTLRTSYATGAGADMMDVSVTVHGPSGTRTVHAQDGTMPEALRRVTGTVERTIRRARGR